METEPDLEPTAQRVRKNVRAIREDRHLKLDDVSERLRELGHPILKSGLSKLEQGKRRVDVDDLVALAIVLDVSPARLLLPAGAASSEQIGLTPNLEWSSLTAWRWASGSAMAPVDPWGAKDVHFDLDRYHRWERENRPHEPDVGPTWNELEEHHEEVAEVSRAISAAQEATGWTDDQIMNVVEASRSIRRMAETYLDAARRAQAGDDGEHQ